MNRCGTCKHFKPCNTPPFGQCGRWHKGYHVELTDMAENEVVVENDEGWAAYMGPDFGCVLHEVADD